jgi:hypothetical protein
MLVKGKYDRMAGDVSHPDVDGVRLWRLRADGLWNALGLWKRTHWRRFWTMISFSRVEATKEVCQQSLGKSGERKVADEGHEGEKFLSGKLRAWGRPGMLGWREG